MIDKIIATRISLLSKSAWSYRDIMDYYPHIKSAPTAIKLKNRAIKTYDGSVPYGSEFATSESILKLFGTDRQKEIETINKIILETKRPVQKLNIDFDNDVGEENHEEN